MTEKKKILFVINNLNVGGAEKALVSLLQVMDYSLYEVDLLLFKNEGLFLKQLPKEVNLLTEPENLKYFDMPFSQMVRENLLKGNLKLVYDRIKYSLLLKNRRTKSSEIHQRSWMFVRDHLSFIQKHYDVAIGFLENHPNYFCIEKVKASLKVGFVHNDYEKLGLNKDFDLPYFQKLDFLTTVSHECSEILKSQFPTLTNKIKILENLVIPEIIEKQSHDAVDEVKSNNQLISIGRLMPQKAYHLAIEAAEILKSKGLEFSWWIIGEGYLRGQLEQQIKELHLENNVLLLGLKNNPYPYLSKSDIFVQTSFFEGKSIAIDEAKIMNKPIVVTNYPSAGDQVAHMETGYVCEMNAESISEGIILLLNNQELREKFTGNLANMGWGTEAEIDKFYALIESDV